MAEPPEGYQSAPMKACGVCKYFYTKNGFRCAHPSVWDCKDGRYLADFDFAAVAVMGWCPQFEQRAQ